MRYSIIKNALSRSLCFPEKNNKINNFFQSIKSLGNTFYNQNNSNKELIYNINSSNINKFINSYEIDKDNNDIQKRQNIFRKPLIKNKTSNNNIINIKKVFNTKRNIYKNNNSNFNINNNNEYNCSKLYKNNNNCAELYTNLYTNRNYYEDNNDIKYKNTNKIRGKSILQRYIKKI